jgi:protein SCO1/2
VKFAAVVLAVAALLAGCSSSAAAPNPGRTSSGLRVAGEGGPSSPYRGMALNPPQPRPAFTLTDTTGRTVDFAAVTRGRPTLLYFGYTRCPDVCPATMADIGQALQKLPSALQKRTYVVFVSTDVKHDTGPVIAKWLKNFDVGTAAHWLGLRGTRAQVDAAQAGAHVFLAEDDGLTHSSQVLLYGSDDYARDSFVYNDTGEAAQIAHDLPLVAAT